MVDCFDPTPEFKGTQTENPNKHGELEVAYGILPGTLRVAVAVHEMLQRQEERLGQVIAMEPVHRAHLVRSLNRGGTGPVLAEHPERNVVPGGLGEDVVGDAHEAHVPDDDAGLLLDLANGARFRRLAEFEVPARRRPGAGPVNGPALEQKQMAFFHHDHAHADQGPGFH